MADTDFETKVAVVVRDDLAGWQRLNVCAFVVSGVTAAAGAAVRCPDRAAAALRGRSQRRILTWSGIALRAPHRDADGVLRGLRRHP